MPLYPFAALRENSVPAFILHPSSFILHPSNALGDFGRARVAGTKKHPGSSSDPGCVGGMRGRIDYRLPLSVVDGEKRTDLEAAILMVSPVFGLRP